MNLSVPRDDLMMQVNIYDESVTVTTIEAGKATVKMVDPDAISHALTGRVTYRSPVLGPDTLWWEVGHEGSVMGLWREPGVRRVAIQLEALKPPVRLWLPMPGMVFACSAGRPPRVYAAKERPTSVDAELYRSPTFNTYRDGRVCPGSHHFPADPNEIPDSFFISFFSRTGDSHQRSHQHPDSLEDLWYELDGEPEYPLEDLVFQCHLGEAMGR